MKKISLLITLLTLTTSLCFANINSCESLFGIFLKDFHLGDIRLQVSLKTELYEARFADHKAFQKSFELLDSSESKIIGFKDDSEGNTIALLLLTPKAAARLMRSLEVEDFVFEFGIISENDYKNLDLRNLESSPELPRYHEAEKEKVPAFRGKTIPKDTTVTRTHPYELTFDPQFRDQLLAAFKQRGIKVLSVNSSSNLVLTVQMPVEELFKFVSQQEGFKEAHPFKPIRRK